MTSQAIGGALAPADALRRPELWLSADAPFAPWRKGVEDLDTYMGLLLKWNRVLNLSARHDALTLLRDLVQDSFFLGSFLDALAVAPEPRTLDLGAGAGLPGIPLRIFWQRGHYTLVEINQKRATFLRNAQARLRLPRMSIHQGDAKAFLKASPPANIILSRAFMPWPQILHLCDHALEANGCLVLMANEGPPCSLPPPWRLIRSTGYALPQDRKRWLWAVALH